MRSRDHIFAYSEGKLTSHSVVLVGRKIEKVGNAEKVPSTIARVTELYIHIFAGILSTDFDN